MPQLDMLHLYLDQLADPCAGGCEEADYEVPKHLIISFQRGFEVFIICLADYILQKGLLLYPDKGHLPFCLSDALQIAVDSSETQIDSLWLVILNQPHLVSLQILLGNAIVLLIVLTDGEQVRCDSVFREVCFSQVSFKFFYHDERPPFAMIIQFSLEQSDFRNQSVDFAYNSVLLLYWRYWNQYTA